MCMKSMKKRKRLHVFVMISRLFCLTSQNLIDDLFLHVLCAREVCMKKGRICCDVDPSVLLDWSNLLGVAMAACAICAREWCAWREKSNGALLDI